MDQPSGGDKQRPHRIKYAHAGLNRAGDLRADDLWLERALAGNRGQVIAVWRSQTLLSNIDSARPGARRLSLSLHAEAEQLVFLGLDKDTPLFAADYSHLEQDRVTELLGPSLGDLRRFGPLLDDHDAAVLAYARGMLHWHRNHQYCGRCGAPTDSHKGGHLRVCPRSSCGHLTFPRTDPAVIVLVEHPRDDQGPPRCLLGRPSSFPPGAYSTLAGFVEPGESLELTVRREVFEESGIQVGPVNYLGSQPWPFPSSLMLGFLATATTSAIKCHDEELEDARWFTIDELSQAGEWGEPATLCLPRPDSIARVLIDTWIARQSDAGPPFSEQSALD